MQAVSLDLTSEISAIRPEPIKDRRAWLGRDIGEDDWLVPFGPPENSELQAMCERMRLQPLQTVLRKPDQFNIPHLTEVMTHTREILDNGCGFAVLDRLPLDSFPIDEMVACFWVLGQLICAPAAQRWDGTMIYDVTDKGQKLSYGVRGSYTNVELVFHNDNAFGIAVPDYVGLMCKYPAADGGFSRFCSLYSLHNRLLAEAPDLLQRLYEPMLYDRQAEHCDGAPATSYAPFFSWRGERLAARANISLVRKGYEFAGEQMDDVLVRALSAIERISADPDLWYEAPIERGQIQYLNNQELGHYRSTFTDHEDPELKRHLYRTWHRKSGHPTYDGV